MTCEKCSGSGRLIPVLDENGRRKERLCDCADGLAIRYRMLPATMRDWTWATFPGSPKAAKAVREWAEQRADWLLLVGPVGTGKTGLAVCAYKALRDDDVPVEFWTANNLLAQEKVTFEKGDSILTKLCTQAVILILDDVGAERGTEWQRTEVARLLQGRYLQTAPTLITSNLTPDEIAEVYGQRVLDRLLERALVLLLTGKSLRVKRGAIRV